MQSLIRPNRDTETSRMEPVAPEFALVQRRLLHNVDELGLIDVSSASIWP